LVNRNCTAQFPYRWLLEVANTYLRDRARSRSGAGKKWNAAADAMADARRAMADACRHNEHFGTPFDDFVEFSRDELEEWKRSLNLLEQWEQSARSAARYDATLAHFGCSPKQHFYNMLLEFWGNAGGHFKRSRAKPNEMGTKSSGKAGGPTVLYVEATVGPVMGKDAPGREAICKLIVRHREFRKRVQAIDAELALAKAG
jgi:hypothetical protein